MANLGQFLGAAAGGAVQGAQVGARFKQQQLAQQLEQQEQDLKNVNDLIKFQKIIDSDSTPEMKSFARQGIALIGVESPKQRTAVPGVPDARTGSAAIPRDTRLDFDRQITAQQRRISGEQKTQSELLFKRGQIKTKVEKERKRLEEKKRKASQPTQGQISFARTRLEKFRKERANLVQSKADLARRHEFDPEVGPPSVTGKLLENTTKAQGVLDQWDQINRQIDSKDASIDSLRTQAKEINITDKQIGFGSEFTPAQDLPSNLPSPEGLAEGTKAKGTDDSLFEIQSSRWVQIK